jgi:hypothetical protein
MRYVQRALHTACYIHCELHVPNALHVTGERLSQTYDRITYKSYAEDYPVKTAH